MLLKVLHVTAPNFGYVQTRANTCASDITLNFATLFRQQNTLCQRKPLIPTQTSMYFANNNSASTHRKTQEKNFFLPGLFRPQWDFWLKQPIFQFVYVRLGQVRQAGAVCCHKFSAIFNKIEPLGSKQPGQKKSSIHCLTPPTTLRVQNLAFNWGSTRSTLVLVS